MLSQNAKTSKAFWGSTHDKQFVCRIFALIVTLSQKPFEMVPEN